MKLTRQLVDAAFARAAPWAIGNETLYELCRRTPGHADDAAIIAKIWLIGRTYAASIERRRVDLEISGDDFYVRRAAPAVRNSAIDAWFAPLAALRRPDAGAVVPVHAKVTAVFEHISGLEKRSLASKYLHFHFPRSVYIYDERAARAVREAVPAQRLRGLPFEPCDETYARFYLRCAQCHEQIEQLLGRSVTPREVDMVLLAVADAAQ